MSKIVLVAKGNALPAGLLMDLQCANERSLADLRRAASSGLPVHVRALFMNDHDRDVRSLRRVLDRDVGGLWSVYELQGEESFSAGRCDTHLIERHVRDNILAGGS